MAIGQQPRGSGGTSPDPGSGPADAGPGATVEPTTATTDPSAEPDPGAGTPAAATASSAAPARPLLAGDRMPRWIPRSILLFWTGFLAVGVIGWLAGRLRGLLIILIVSLFLSLAIEPAVNVLARRGWRRGAATGTVMVGLFAVMAVFFGAMGALIVRQAADFVDQAPDYIEELEQWVNDTFDTNIDANELIERLTEEGGPLRRAAERLAGDTLRVSGTVAGWLLQLLSVFLFTFYLVADGPRFRRAVCSVLRPDLQQEVLRAWDVAIDKTGGYLYSRALLALLSGLFHYVAFTVVGVPNALVLAIWVGIVSQFIPVIGTYLAGALPVLIALIDQPSKALWVLGFVVVYQQIENYLFAPRISARTMELHPAVAFAAVLAGGAMFGAVGALLALPSAATLQAFASLYVDRHEVVESDLTSATPGARKVSRRRRVRDERPAGGGHRRLGRKRSVAPDAQRADHDGPPFGTG